MGWLNTIRDWTRNAPQAIRQGVQALIDRRIAAGLGVNAEGPGDRSAGEFRDTFRTATDSPASLTDTPPNLWSGTSDTPPHGLWGPNEDVALRGDWVTMASSNVDEIRYLASEQTLEVKFLNNYFYQYYNVPAQTFLDFLATDSPGRFVWNRLRYWFEYARIGAGAIEPRRTAGGNRNARVIRRLPSEDDPQRIAREHARRLDVEGAWRTGRRQRSWT